MTTADVLIFRPFCLSCMYLSSWGFEKRLYKVIVPFNMLMLLTLVVIHAGRKEPVLRIRFMTFSANFIPLKFSD